MSKITIEYFYFLVLFSKISGENEKNNYNSGILFYTTGFRDYNTPRLKHSNFQLLCSNSTLHTLPQATKAMP